MPSVHAAQTGTSAVPAQDALIYVMVMLSAADGQMTDIELTLIGDIVKHLPVFRSFDVNTLTDVARDCTHHLSLADGMHHTLHLIKHSLPTHLYETAYALGCDLAASDGAVSPEEMRLLELLRHELNIDRLHAAAIERGARARYLMI